MNLRTWIIGIASLLFVGVASCSKKGGGTANPPITPPTTPPTPVWDPNAMRGVWVTNVASTALDSRENIRACVQQCKSAGINHIFMVVYNNARTIYPSTIMQNLIGISIQEKFAGRDPLKEMIEEAQAQGLKVHAWFEYGFSSSYSQNGGPIVNAKPHWAARDAGGNLTVKNGFDWLNAFHPEVQQYMIDLFKEVIIKYPTLDGVQGDDRLPALPSTAGYDAYTVSEFKAEHAGAEPSGDYRDTYWIDWRTKRLNAFLKRLRTEVKTLKPSIQFTMSPSPFPWGKAEYLQDWPTWVDSGWVDAVIPQCYRYNITDYNATIAQQKSYYRNPAVPLYPGVLLCTGGTTAQPDALLTQFIQTNRRNGFKGEVFFYYEGVKDKKSWFEGQYPYTQ
jgi:uncharacterized lipoprotein YddW (UPF0748 family)